MTKYNKVQKLFKEFNCESDNINFIENLNSGISLRVRNLINNLGNQISLIDAARMFIPETLDTNPQTYRRQLSDIINGKRNKLGRSFITDHLVSFISNTQNIKPEYILFGERYEIRELVMCIYINVIYSFEPDLPKEYTIDLKKHRRNNYYCEELLILDKKYSERLEADMLNRRISKYNTDEAEDMKSVQKAINNCLLFKADLAYAYSAAKRELFNDFHNDKYIDRYVFMNSPLINLYYDNFQTIYDEAVFDLWEVIAENLTDAFIEKFGNSNIDYLSFIRGVIKWIRKDLYEVILCAYTNLRNDKITNLGFIVYNDMEDARKLEVEKFVGFDSFEFEAGILPPTIIEEQELFLKELLSIMYKNIDEKIKLQNDYWFYIGKVQSINRKIYNG